MTTRRFPTVIMAGLALALTVTSVSAEGRLREKIRERVQEKRAERQAERQAGRQDPGPNVALQKVELSHNGTTRSYFIDPATVGAGRGAVLVFHGGGGDGAKAAGFSDMAQAALAGGFVAVFPNSPGQQWNDGRASTRSSFDDVDYARAVVRDLGSRFGVDTGRVYAAGISNGGMMVQRLACDTPDTFRAFAAIAANMPSDYASSCQPSRARPMMFFNGTADRIMPHDGGSIASSRAAGKGKGGSVLSHDQTLSLWSGKAGCGAPSTSRQDKVKDGTSLSRAQYSCAGGVDLDVYVIEGGGHTWPGSDLGGGRIAGKVSQEVDATAAMVAFFEQYGL